MANLSPAAQAKNLETLVNYVLRKFDLTRLGTDERENLLALKQDLTHGRIYTSDYELSETREEQITNARRARQWLFKARAKILKASESNIFSAADVAQLSAQIDQISGDLK
jgi:hypothetical protein